MCSSNTNVDNWYPNSGASNHLTYDSTGFTKIDYNGSDQIRTANGTCLSIKSIGQSSFLSSNRVFHLCNILHVPFDTKNLLSVS